MISMLRPLIEKVDNTQEQMDNISRDMEETLKKNQKKNLEIRNVVIKMKNAFDRHIIDLTQLMNEAMSMKTGQEELLNLKCKEINKCQNKQKIHNKTSKICGVISNVQQCRLRIPTETNEAKDIFDVIMAQNSPKFSHLIQEIQNTKQEKYQEKCTHRHIIQTIEN